MRADVCTASRDGTAPAAHDTSELLARGVEALERIAAVLERFEPVAAAPCAHPMSEREVLPGATMTQVAYRCKACGAEGI